MVPTLPALTLLAAHQFQSLLAHNRRLGLAIAVVVFGWWALELAQCYPDYNLNGFQWVGIRPLFGRSSIGYRSVAMTPSDGVQQAVEWLNANALAGETAQLYVLPWHIVHATAGAPAYRLEDGLKGSLYSNPDYVVIHINAIIWQGWGTDTPRGKVIVHPYDPIYLGQRYTKVFSVQRAFGLEVASVWKMK